MVARAIAPKAGRSQVLPPFNEDAKKVRISEAPFQMGVVR